jgi:hypothetical protein
MFLKGQRKAKCFITKVTKNKFSQVFRQREIFIANLHKRIDGVVDKMKVIVTRNQSDM